MVQNKKKARIIILLIGSFSLLLLVTWLFYPFNCDSLPPKTPLKIARKITGFDIPDDVDVIHFKREEQSLGGDYVDEIVIQLTSEQTTKMQREWEQQGYGDEPIPKPDPEFTAGQGDFITQNTAPSDTGLFWHSSSKTYWSTFVLDLTTNRLIIFDASD